MDILMAKQLKPTKKLALQAARMLELGMLELGVDGELVVVAGNAMPNFLGTQRDLARSAIAKLEAYEEARAKKPA